MPTLRTIAAQLFTLPGGPPREIDLLSRTARAHQHLFARECERNAALSSALPLLKRRLHSCPDEPPAFARLFCHPSLVEGLHRLAGICPHLNAWHRAVASPCATEVFGNPASGFGCLGPIEFALRIRECAPWNDLLRINTDMFGRVPWPFSDWTLSLQSASTANQGVLSCEPVEVWASRRSLHWQWIHDDAPFLTIQQEDCRRMVLGASDADCGNTCRCDSTRIQPVLTRASAFCASGARYDPVQSPAHAQQTGMLMRALHEALKQNSPCMHREFCTLIFAVRSFETPIAPGCNLHSFSDPALPGVVNFNVPYSHRGEPCLSSLCFTWLAHELAHTRFYMINDVAYDHGWVFVNNGSEMTDVLPRYGRCLPVRTLFQIPYTHLYEWTVLMDFLAGGLSQLPWAIDENPYSYGEELSQEIDEGLDLADRMAAMTSLGRAAFLHFSELYADAILRWRSLKAA